MLDGEGPFIHEAFRSNGLQQHPAETAFDHLKDDRIRSSDHLWKERDIQGEIYRVAHGTREASGDIDQIAHRLEGEEEDSDGGNDPRSGHLGGTRRATVLVDGIHDEIGVFELARYSQADHFRQANIQILEGCRVTSSSRMHHPAQSVVRDDDNQKKEAVLQWPQGQVIDHHRQG